MQVAPEESLLGALRGYLDRLKAGDLGSLPVVLAMVGIVSFFTVKAPVFFTAVNFNDLVEQISGPTLVAIGVVFVLLLGEIDLSVAYLSGLGGVAIAYFQTQGHGYSVPGLVAILIGLALCSAFGAFQGSFVAFIGVPSFVVTLAGNFALQGVIIKWIPSTRAIAIQDKYINDVASYHLPPTAGWIVAVVVSAALALAAGARLLSRRRAGLPLGNPALIVIRWGFVTAVAVVVVAICNHSRGIPFAGLLAVVLVAFWTWVATRTTFGRHVYAVGGNPEAARRAGINVSFIRLSVFMISGLMSAVGGLELASRLQAVSTNVGTGAGQSALLLNVIAAAVIGGTSLFGGRGRIVAALTGSTVIMSISNGLDLMGSSGWEKYVITGIILLAAVMLDSVARARQQKVGR